MFTYLRRELRSRLLARRAAPRADAGASDDAGAIPAASPAATSVAPEPAPSTSSNDSAPGFRNALALALALRANARDTKSLSPESYKSALRAALVEYLHADAAAVTNANLLLAAGSTALLLHLIRERCGRGRGSLLFAEPGPSRYREVACALGVHAVAVGRADDDLSIDLEDARARMAGASSRPRVRVVLVGHPNAPTGNPLVAEELAWLRSLPQDVLVVIDEGYYEYAAESLVAEAIRRPNWIVLRTLSRAFGLATHRVGYAVARADQVAALTRARAPSVPVRSMLVARLALDHRHELLARVPRTRRQRRRVYQQLVGAPAAESVRVWPSRCDSLFLRVAPLSARESQASVLARRDIVVERLAAAGFRVGAAADGLRVYVGEPREDQRMLAALERTLARWGHGSKRTRDARRKRRFFSSGGSSQGSASRGRDASPRAHASSSGSFAT